MTLPVFSFGKKEKPQEPSPQIVRVTGIVRLVGSANFPEIVISAAAENSDDPAEAGPAAGGQANPADSGNVIEIQIDGNRGAAEWYVPKDEMDKLNHLQHRTVTVEGEEIIIQLRFANGLAAGIRRELRNVRIISVD